MKKIFSKKTLSAFLAVIMTMTAMVGMLTFSAGAETASPDWDADEITLYTADDVLTFVSKLNSGETFAGKTLKLANDIELNSNWTATDKNNKPSTLWSISNTAGFAGTFDGNYHVLSGIYAELNAHDNGIFGMVVANTSASVKNLKITNSFIYGKKCRMGGFFGGVKGTVNFENVYFDAILFGDVTPDAHGGFVGYMHTGSTVTINNCIMSGTVNGATVQKNTASDGTVTYKYAGAGGFVSATAKDAIKLSITNSAMYGTVQQALGNLGGIVDDTRITCTIENVIVAGSVPVNSNGNANYVVRNPAGTLTRKNVFIVKEDGKNISGASKTDATIINASDITGIAAQTLLNEKGMTAFAATTTGYPMPKTLIKTQTPTADENALTNYIGYQTTKVTDGKFGLRLVANLDKDTELSNYENVGFKVVAFFADGTKVMANNCVQTKVYDSITTTTADGTASFAQQGKYIFVQECLNITTASGDITFEVTTYATDSEGNETLGATYRFVVDVSEIPSAS